MMTVGAQDACGRWLGVGRSVAVDAAQAGAAAVAEAVDGRLAKLVIVFASERYDLPRLVGEIAAGAPGADLIGCGTAGEIAAGGVAERGVVVVALGGDGFSVATAVASGVGVDPRGAGAHVAGAMERTDEHPHRVLLLLTEGLFANQEEVIRGAYGVLGPGVPLVGGSAGDRPQVRCDASVPRRRGASRQR